MVLAGIISAIGPMLPLLGAKSKRRAKRRKGGKTHDNYAAWKKQDIKSIAEANMPKFNRKNQAKLSYDRLEKKKGSKRSNWRKK